MSAWSKCELGWVMLIKVGWQGAVLDLPPVVTHPIAYELSFTDERWTRRGDCPIDGDFSLALGLSEEQLPGRTPLTSVADEPPVEAGSPATPSTEELIDDLSTLLKKRSKNVMMED